MTLCQSCREEDVLDMVDHLILTLIKVTVRAKETWEPKIPIKVEVFMTSCSGGKPRSHSILTKVTRYEDHSASATMLGFHQSHQHHQQQQQLHHQHQHLMQSSADQVGGGGDNTYLRKRFREDLFKDESISTHQGERSGEDSGGGKQQHQQQQNQNQQSRAMQEAAAAAAMRSSNVVPATAMWAVAGGGGGGGGAFWMLPVTAGTAPSAVMGPTSESIWTFPTAGQAAAPYRGQIPGGGGGGGGGTLQAPLQFMSRVNVSSGMDFGSGGGGGGRVGTAVPIGSMLGMGTPQQHLGLGMSETNLGMLAALNAFNRGGGGGGGAGLMEEKIK
ncbi:hypothetical protein QJS10_CPB13g00666 [Acorus calamus]|uniref:Uncharacterized protein n=1 Tax=Acorus calamus TaxID=4465 RepID=A0AAV9DI35_ACOCL|nr:hypothetical protein QJS10_CPB13g00666 [Acorus calamus]